MAAKKSSSKKKPLKKKTEQQKQVGQVKTNKAMAMQKSLAKSQAKGKTTQLADSKSGKRKAPQSAKAKPARGKTLPTAKAKAARQGKTKPAFAKTTKISGPVPATAMHKPARYNIVTLIPLLLIVTFVPLIVYIWPVNLSDIEVIYTGLQRTVFDIFAYGKMVCLLILTGAALISFLIKRNTNPFDRQKSIYYIPLGIYTVFVLLSALAAEHRTVAFRGFWERYEGAFALIAYLIIAFLAMNAMATEREKPIKALFICLFSSSAIIGVIGITQYMGFDYFDNSLVQKIITPGILKGLGGEFKSMMSAKTVYITMYNPNYIGSYTAMLIPAITVFIIGVKNIAAKIAMIPLLALNLFTLLVSNSKAGMAGVAAAVLIALVLLWKKLLRNIWVTIIAAIILAGAAIAVNHATDGAILNRAVSIVEAFKRSIGTSAEEGKSAFQERYPGLTDIHISSARAQIVTEKGTLQIELPGGVFRVMDEKRESVAYSIEKNMVSFEDPRFQLIKLNTNTQEGIMKVTYNGKFLIEIAFTENGLVSRTNRWMTLRGGREIESIGFDGRERFASSRGYIWSRAIPLLKNTFFLGHGPDTFALYFPQYDFIGKLKIYNSGIFVDKVHNIYLQTGVNTGVISLMALLTLFGAYFIISVRLYIREQYRDFLPVAGLACFVSFCGYAAAGMFNDSVVSTAPVFWVLLGLGAGINILLAQKRGSMGKAERRHG